MKIKININTPITIELKPKYSSTGEIIIEKMTVDDGEIVDMINGGLEACTVDTIVSNAENEVITIMGLIAPLPGKSNVGADIIFKQNDKVIKKICINNVERVHHMVTFEEK